MVTIAPDGKHANDHGEECEVYGGRKKAVRESEVVDAEKYEVGDRQRSGPALGDENPSAFCEQVSANGEGDCDQKPSREIESACDGEHAKSGKYQQVEPDFEVVIDVLLEQGAAGLGWHGHSLHCSTSGQKKGRAWAMILA